MPEKILPSCFSKNEAKKEIRRKKVGKVKARIARMIQSDPTTSKFLQGVVKIEPTENVQQLARPEELNPNKPESIHTESIDNEVIVCTSIPISDKYCR